MNWTEIKKSITESLLSRELKNPNIRMNSLRNIESIMQEHFVEFIKNPNESFSNTKKKDFIEQISKFKESNRLNSAEISIINEIYYRIN